MSQTTRLMGALFRELRVATLVLPIGCGSNASNSGAQPLQDGGEASAQPQVEAGGSNADATGRGADTGADTSGSSADAGPLDYFVGHCRFAGDPGAVRADAGALPHGLTVLATGVQGPAGLEVDATYAYFAAASTISRIPLGGGPSVLMVANANPVAIGIAGNALVWSDASLPMQTRILSAPLTAVGWVALASTDGGATPTDAGHLDAGADAAAPIATTLATLPGGPGAFTIAGGYAYFAAGAVIARVPATGGNVETVASGLGPTGIAVSSTTAYLGDGNNDVIDEAMLGVPDGGPIGLFAQSNGTPTQLALNGTDLYWGDWFGSIDHVALATPYHFTGSATPCAGGACYPRHVRTGGPGVVWESGDNICGHVGTAGPQGSTLFARDIAAVQSIAADAHHLYATTLLGELLRWDL